jgi:ATP-binding cassette subfamily F protein uup
LEVYLQVENISKSFGDLVLIENINFSIHKGEKVAIIAKNGAGKSTLLNIITKNDTSDTGNVIFKNDLKIKFLSQNINLDESKEIADVLFDNNEEIGRVLKEYEIALHNNNQEKLTLLIDKIDGLSAWDYQREITELLNRLKIEDLNQKVSTLSGGQKKRVALALTLIGNPDLIILDEPTNHLDLEVIEWLEEHLKNSKSTLLMVTHDRYFLDRVCNNIIELEDNSLYKYKGNYNYYLQKREERIAQQTAEVDKAKNLLSKELDWMRRMPKARSTKAKYRIDAFYDLKDKASHKFVEEKVDAKVQTQRLGKKILEIKNLFKSFGENNILTDFSYSFQRDEKICIIGKNGTGKSTFLNLITENIPADSGVIDKGQTVVFGYFKQDGIKINENEKIIDVITNIAEVVDIGKGNKVSASAFLNYFLFPPKRQQTLVSKLSGGEKRRLYLLTVLIKNPNFLILDEPTNDLDIMTLNVLEEFLMNYSGVVIIVSHDRYFTDKVADRLFVFEEKGKIKGFEGNYTQYLDFKKYNDSIKKNTKAEKTSEIKENKTKNDYSKKLSFNEKREFEELEKTIPLLEEKKKELEIFLSSGTTNHQELLEKSEEIKRIIDELDEKELRWLELSEKV